MKHIFRLLALLYASLLVVSCKETINNQRSKQAEGQSISSQGAGKFSYREIVGVHTFECTVEDEIFAVKGSQEIKSNGQFTGTVQFLDAESKCAPDAPILMEIVDSGYFAGGDNSGEIIKITNARKTRFKDSATDPFSDWCHWSANEETGYLGEAEDHCRPFDPIPIKEVSSLDKLKEVL